MENLWTMQICGHLANPGPAWEKFHFYLTNRIHYVVSGTMFYKGKRRLKENHLYIFPADPDFNVTQDEKDPVDHVYFDFISSRPLDISEYLEIDVEKIPGLKEILASAQKTLNFTPKARRLGTHYFSAIMELLSDCIPLCEYESHFTAPAINLIHETDFKELSVKGISAALNVNEDHFIRCFKKDTGKTPHQYISLYKTDVATSCISSGKSIKEVADILGFSSASAFCTFYKNNRHSN